MAVDRLPHGRRSSRQARAEGYYDGRWGDLDTVGDWLDTPWWWDYLVGWCRGHEDAGLRVNGRATDDRP